LFKGKFGVRSRGKEIQVGIERLYCVYHDISTGTVEREMDQESNGDSSNSDSLPMTVSEPEQTI
jgi:hypothetical protein